MKTRIVLAVAALAALLPCTAVAWEPQAKIEIVTANSLGGGADQMARKMASIINEKKLTPHPVVVTNRTIGQGSESLYHVKLAHGNAHKLLIFTTSAFTLPVEHGLPFRIDMLEPVALLGLDDFVLWVHNDAPYTTAAEFGAALKSANGAMRMGGTNRNQEDSIVATQIEKVFSGRFTYVPYSGGGAVANALASKQLDATVNNPSEAVKQWAEGKVRPLCVFREDRIAQEKAVAAGKGWNGVPTCTEQGLPVRYQMMRGIVMPKGTPRGALAYYQALFAKVVETSEWKTYLADNAIAPAFLVGGEFLARLKAEETRHAGIMANAGLAMKN